MVSAFAFLLAVVIAYLALSLVTGMVLNGVGIGGNDPGDLKDDLTLGMIIWFVLVFLVMVVYLAAYYFSGKILF